MSKELPRSHRIAIAKIKYDVDRNIYYGYLTNVEYLLLCKIGLEPILSCQHNKWLHEYAKEEKQKGIISSHNYRFKVKKTNTQFPKPIQKRHENKT